MEGDEIMIASGTEFSQPDINPQMCANSVCCDALRSYITEDRYETPSSPPHSLSEQGLDTSCCSPPSCSPPALHHQQQQGLLNGEGPVGGSSSPEGFHSQNTGGSVARRNERERKRVRMVNMGFAKLRQYVPTATRGKRLSKVETLRSAIDYIRQLRQLLVYHQQYVEDTGAEYYHHHQQQQQHHYYDHPQSRMSAATAFHFAVPPRHRGFVYDGGMPAAFAGEPQCETGCSSTWSVSSESPSPSIESEMSPNCGGIMEADSQMTCWAM